MNKNLLLRIASAFCLITPVFAIDCQDKDEKFIKIDATKLATNMYNEQTFANQIKTNDYKFSTGFYTGGRWALKNENDDNLNVIGISICADNNETLDFKNIKMGTYCWCNIESIDNYNVLSQWSNIREYDRYQFDATKYANNKTLAQQKERETKDKNIQECMSNCAKSCQTFQSSLIHKIKGFYICANALYKIQNVRCVINNKFIRANSISIFDDVAEFRIMNGDFILFTPDSANNALYVGEYENETIYLELKDDHIYIGREKRSMEECL